MNGADIRAFTVCPLRTGIRIFHYRNTIGQVLKHLRLEELDNDAVCHQFCSTCTANALPRKLWMGLGTSTSEGKLFKL